MLGVDGVALICHGGSNARAIKNAVRVASRFAKSGLGHETSEAVGRHAFLWDAMPVAPAAEARS
jgi:glycerol-3-phosphate acyltransferase PlsX